MYRTVLLPLAKKDIREIYNWYNQRQEGLGNRFLIQLRKKILTIRQFPKAARIRYDNMHVALLDVFPYMIHYAVNEEQEEIVIASILSMSRNPEIWTERSKKK